MARFRFMAATAMSTILMTGPALAQPAGEIERLQAQIAIEQAALREQKQRLEDQQKRLDALEAQLLGSVRGMGTGAATAGGNMVPMLAAQAAGSAAQPSGTETAQTVGEAPPEATRPPEVAVLADQGGVLSRPGQLTLEGSAEYTRADRNRVIFRGIEVVESVLVGVFDINESRQDVLTGALTGRLGLSNRFQIDARLPYVYRSEDTVLAPIIGSNNPPGSDAGIRSTSINGNGIGDVEATLRYQFNRGRGGWPFLIGNLQFTAPTGKDPFEVGRDAIGNPVKAATGAGYWSISPSLTAILPTDPAVLFGNIGYTYNFSRNPNVRIGSALLERIEPGSELDFSAGISVSLNQRTSFNLGYAHTWIMGTKTRLRFEECTLLPPGPQCVYTDPTVNKSRDLQLGRLLLGIAYRTSNNASIIWSVEIGATEDSSDVRSVLRIPFTFNL